MNYKVLELLHLVTHLFYISFTSLLHLFCVWLLTFRSLGRIASFEYRICLVDTVDFVSLPALLAADMLF